MFNPAVDGDDGFVDGRGFTYPPGRELRSFMASVLCRRPLSRSARGHPSHDVTILIFTVEAGPVDKDEILDAIRRYAERSGGKAPGRIRFEQETGIRFCWPRSPL